MTSDQLQVATTQDNVEVLTAPTAAQRATAQAFLTRAAEIHRAHVVSGQLMLGQAALELLFDGDINRFHDRSAAQQRSLQLLADEFADDLERLGLTVEAIRRCVLAWKVDSQLPLPLRGQLSATHLVRLGAVASPSDRVGLANEALSQGWSAKDTAEAVADYRARNGQAGKGGRKPQPEPIRVMRRLERELTEVLAKPLDELGNAHIEELRQLAKRMLGLLDRLG